MIAKRIGAALAAVMALCVASPASAYVATYIRIQSALPSFLQIAELEVWSGDLNVALASNGATAFGGGNWPPTTPDLAIDGIIDQDFPNVYHSDGDGGTEVLQVNFAKAYEITKIVIYGRTDCCDDRNYFKYELYNQGQYGAVMVWEGLLDARGPNSTATAFVPGNTGGPGEQTGVPEPATWALMIGGFGVAGATLRRRRGAPAPAA